MNELGDWIGDSLIWGTPWTLPWNPDQPFWAPCTMLLDVRPWAAFNHHGHHLSTARAPRWSSFGGMHVIVDTSSNRCLNFTRLYCLLADVHVFECCTMACHPSKEIGFLSIHSQRCCCSAGHNCELFRLFLWQEPFALQSNVHQCFKTILFRICFRFHAWGFNLLGPSCVDP